jgi:hypothetical protein
VRLGCSRLRILNAFLNALEIFGLEAACAAIPECGDHFDGPVAEKVPDQFA